MMNQLSRSPLFKGLTGDAMEQIFQNLTYQTKHYPPKVTVATQGEACNFLMIMISGAVQGQMMDFSGKLIVIEDIPAPRLIAPAFLYAENGRFPVNVVATQESDILFIHKPEFTDLLQKDKIILQNFLIIISNRSKFLSEKIMFLGFKSLKGKIAAFLLQHYQNKQSTEFEMPETQQELADYFGVERPSLARVMKEMKEEKIIDFRGKKIRLLDLSRLGAMQQGTTKG